MPINRPTRRKLERRREVLLACQTLDDLARLLSTRPERLTTLALNPPYREFTIPKKDGSKRLIQDPLPPLKRIQDYLNDFLQAVYYAHRTEAAYGFMINPVDDPSPRHILRNAERHLGRPWLLNLDLADFFHSISTARVQEVFSAPLFGYADELAEWLAQLLTYQGRLPMGAPTSPVLSNLATIPLDHDLEDYSQARGWTYTRYADDLSFSSAEPIAEEQVEDIRIWVENYGFQLQDEKKRLFGPQDRHKEVTGLIVSGEKVELPEGYLPMLEAAIHQLSKVLEAQRQLVSGRRGTTPWVEDMRQAIHGKLEFARHILGEDHFWVRRLTGEYLDALEPPDDFGPLSWLEFGYDFHW